MIESIELVLVKAVNPSLLVYNFGVFLQLSPEDDGQHRETDGGSKSQVRVEQQGEDEGGHPDHLGIRDEESDW